MGSPEPLPIDVGLLGAGQVVVDLVYHPPVTPAAGGGPGPGAPGGQRAGHAHPPGRPRLPPLDRGGSTARGHERGCGGRPGPGASGRRAAPKFGLKSAAATCRWVQRPTSPPEVSVALQGTLDTFALPDVLRLLAATKKTGPLRLTGGRGTGSVWVTAGEVSAIEATHAPHASEPVDALFELLRFQDGAFTFDAEAVHDSPGRPTAVEDVLLARLRRSSRSGGPSRPWCRHWTLGSTLRRPCLQPEVTLDQPTVGHPRGRWRRRHRPPLRRRAVPARARRLPDREGAGRGRPRGDRRRRSLRRRPLGRGGRRRRRPLPARSPSGARAGGSGTRQRPTSSTGPLRRGGPAGA